MGGKVEGKGERNEEAGGRKSVTGDERVVYGRERRLIMEVAGVRNLRGGGTGGGIKREKMC